MSVAAGGAGVPLENGFRSLDEIDQEPPRSITRLTLYAVLGLFAILCVWAIFGKLDIIASAEGRLVPQSFVKIVQPADAGVVRDILVNEGQMVEAGQVLLRMDSDLSDADGKALKAELALRNLQLRRIDAELSGATLAPQVDEPADLYRQTQAQYQDHRRSYADAISQEQEVLRKAKSEHAAAREVLSKLRQTVPMLQQQAQAFAELGKDGYVGSLQAQDKQREYVERAQDLRAQESTVESLSAATAQSNKRLEQINSSNRSTLQNERMEAQSQSQKARQEWSKQQTKAAYLELRAPQAGIVKDLATHTRGTVVTPGTILLTLVPQNEPLVAEIQIHNEDVGFVHNQLATKVKLVAYPFQKYGMLDGVVTHLGPDTQDGSSSSARDGSGKDKAAGAASQTYKALVTLDRQTLSANGEELKLVPGMQVVAEINQGRRTVMEYLLSPVQKTVRESGRER